ncbi:uncharacterized protein LOC116603920 [Nematostella vectensis]|uniref:uncharacterized protein LOC116603920 n=1 Tax=Nematostella vectensis TaxID=45351 RepID=UPI0020776A3C|nr:uncharacterized protein LOC116603920 [Nematostella vectensis]
MPSLRPFILVGLVLVISICLSEEATQRCKQVKFHQYTATMCCKDGRKTPLCSTPLDERELYCFCCQQDYKLAQCGRDHNGQYVCKCIPEQGLSGEAENTTPAKIEECRESNGKRSLKFRCDNRLFQ